MTTFAFGIAALVTSNTVPAMAPCVVDCACPTPAAANAAAQSKASFRKLLRIMWSPERSRDRPGPLVESQTGAVASHTAVFLPASRIRDFPHQLRDGAQRANLIYPSVAVAN